MHSEESEFTDEENFVEDTLFSLYWPSINYPDDIASIADVLLEETNRMKVTSWDIHAVCDRMGLNLVDCTISLTPEMETMLKPVEKQIPAIDYSKIYWFKKGAKQIYQTSPAHSVYHFYLKKLNVIENMYNEKNFTENKSQTGDDILCMIQQLRNLVYQYMTIIRGFLNMTSGKDKTMMYLYDLDSNSNRNYTMYEMPDKQRLLFWFINGALFKRKLDKGMVMEQQKVYDYGEPERVNLPALEKNELGEEIRNIDLHERITIDAGEFQGCHGYVYENYTLIRKGNFTHKFQLQDKCLSGCCEIPLSSVRVTSFECEACERSEGYHMRIKNDRMNHAFKHRFECIKSLKEYNTHVWSNGVPIGKFIADQCCRSKLNSQLFNVYTTSAEIPYYLEKMIQKNISENDIERVKPDKNYYAFINGIYKRATTTNGLVFEPAAFYPYTDELDLGVDVSKFFNIYYDAERFSDDFVLGYSLDPHDPLAREFYVPNIVSGKRHCVFCNCEEGKGGEVCYRRRVACCFYHEKQEKIRNIPTPYLNDIFEYQGVDSDTMIYVKFLLARLMHDCKTDHFEVALYIKGAAQSGKSVMNEFIKYFFAHDAVGTMGVNVEENYPLAGVYDKEMVCFAEVDDKLASKFNQMILQKMISGETVAITKKFVDTFTIEWKAPLLFTANAFLSLKDNQGSIVRRFVTIHMSNAVTSKNRDGDLLKKLRSQESPAVLTAFSHVYSTIVTRCQRKGDIYNILPEYFHMTRRNVQSQTDTITKLFQETHGELVFGKEYYASFKDLTTMIYDFTKKHKLPSVDMSNKDRYAFSFKSHNLTVVEETRLYPPIADDKSLPMPVDGKFVVGVGFRKHFPQERLFNENVFKEEIALYLKEGSPDFLHKTIERICRKRKIDQVE